MAPMSSTYRQRPRTLPHQTSRLILFHAPISSMSCQRPSGEQSPMVCDRLRGLRRSGRILLLPYLQSAVVFGSTDFSHRQRAVSEFFRVLKPGGLMVLNDSAQLGDR